MKTALAILTAAAVVNFTHAIDSGFVPPLPPTHTKIVSQCLARDSFYIPFFNPQQQPTLPLSAENQTGTPSPILLIPGANTHDQQNAVVGNDGSVSGGCLGCEEVMRMIYAEQTAIATTHSQCQSSDQCRVAWASTSLRGGCSSIVNVVGEVQLNQWVNRWDKWFEESNQKDQYHQRCGYATPRCMVPMAACIEGKCSAVDEEGKMLW